MEVIKDINSIKEEQERIEIDFKEYFNSSIEICGVKWVVTDITVHYKVEEERFDTPRFYVSCGFGFHEQVNVITWINALVEGEPVDLQRLGFCLLGTTKDYIEVEHSHLYE